MFGMFGGRISFPQSSYPMRIGMAHPNTKNPSVYTYDDSTPTAQTG